MGWLILGFAHHWGIKDVVKTQVDHDVIGGTVMNLRKYTSERWTR